jgi:hypothetical protein
MLDFIYLIVIVVFFIVASVYLAGCESLKRREGNK